MDESRIIIDWKEQGDDSYDIEVVGMYLRLTRLYIPLIGRLQ